VLGWSRFEFDGLLKARDIYDHAHDMKDLDRDREDLRKFKRVA
jgi:hypothetical protein